MKRVVLNARRLPTISEAMPQKEAPTHNPTKMEQVVYRTWVALGPNSDVSDGKVSATTWKENQCYGRAMLLVSHILEV